MGNAILAYGGTTPTVAAQLLAEAGIDPRRRPETLAITELCCIADGLSKMKS